MGGAHRDKPVKKRTAIMISILETYHQVRAVDDVVCQPLIDRADRVRILVRGRGRKLVVCRSKSLGIELLMLNHALHHRLQLKRISVHCRILQKSSRIFRLNHR